MLKFKLLLARIIINLSINFIFIRTHFRSHLENFRPATLRIVSLEWQFPGEEDSWWRSFLVSSCRHEKGRGIPYYRYLKSIEPNCDLGPLLNRNFNGKISREATGLSFINCPWSTNSIETREKEGGVSKLKLSLVNTPLYAATITREWNFAPSIEGKKKRWRDPSSSSYLTDRDIGRGWWIVGERLAEARRRGGIRKFTVKSCANGSKVTHFRFIEGEVPFELKELGALANGESSVERERERGGLINVT